MCCFTEIVDEVSDTSIFARARGDRQLVVYSMNYAARSELAMVLPIPVVPRAAEESVRFIDLEDCPEFFAQMRDGFATGDTLSLGEGEDLGALVVERPKLRVHDVGAFEASFVPSPGDFGRLDPRFRLPVPIWLQLNHYRDWGFAVFKLKPTALARVHPMAFEFPTRDAKRLFFPTLHLHGKALDKRADFDHALYCQPAPSMQWHLEGWEDSLGPASEFMRCEAARALVDLRYPCWKLDIKGMRENRDTWIGAGETPPR